MHLTPIQRTYVVAIYESLLLCRNTNRAKETVRIAAQQNVIISERAVKAIIMKWSNKSNFLLE
jgi:hypothetical protein